MTDETKNVSKLTPEQIKGVEEFNIGGDAYTLRDEVEIPDKGIENWVSIPIDQSVVVTLTRGDFDRLYFSMMQMSASSTMLAQTIRLLSFGDLEGANASHRKASELI